MDPGDGKGCPLVEAAGSGQVEEVRVLLCNGWCVEGRGWGGTRTPLHAAAAGGHQEVVDVLLQAGADVEAVSTQDKDKRAIHLGCRSGGSEVVRRLVQAGANIHARERTGWVPLHEACLVGDEESVKLLVSAGADVEVETQGGWKAIHRAALGGFPKVVEILLDAGANIQPVGEDCSRPINFAAMRGHIDVMKLLVERGCSVFILDNSGSTVLHSAAAGGQLLAVQWLVEHGLSHKMRDYHNRTPEEIAQLYGYSDVAWWLYKQNLDASPPQHTQARMSLLECERLGKLAVYWAVRGEHVNITSHFPSRPWRIHFQDSFGWTPLHHAAYHNEKTTVESLLALGAYKGSRSLKQSTPSDIARLRGHKELAQLLQLPLLELNRSEKVRLYEELLHTISCAEMDSKPDNDSCPVKDDKRRLRVVQEVTRLLTEGAPLMPPGGYTVYPLHLAIQANCIDLLPLLLSAGAPLVTTAEGLGVLEQAWLSSDVTTNIPVLITRAMIQRLDYEMSLVSQEGRPGSVIVNLLIDGISHILGNFMGRQPWRASWPPLPRPSSHDRLEQEGSSDNRDSKHRKVDLTELLQEASQLGLTLTASFLARSGAYSTSYSSSGVTALHAALDAGRQDTAVALVRYMAANIFLQDQRGRTPLDLSSRTLGTQLMEDTLSHDFCILDFMVNKVQSSKDKESFIDVILLLAALHTQNMTVTEKGIVKVKDEAVPNTLPGYWKSLFVHLVSMLREESVSFCDAWLEHMICCLSNKDYDPDNQTCKIQHVRNEEELFLDLTDVLKQIDSKAFKVGELNEESNELIDTTLRRAMTIAAKQGMNYLMHLLLTIGHVDVNMVVETVSGSSTLHVVAAHGQFGMCNFLLSHQASTSVLDHASRTPAHIAAMFGHSGVGGSLISGVQDFKDNANCTPKYLRDSFKKYEILYSYQPKAEKNPQQHNDPSLLIRLQLKHLKRKWRGNILRAVKKSHISFTEGEAKEIKEILTKELERLMKELEGINPLFACELQVLGSSADNLRLNAPDEFDCNVVLKNISGFPGGRLAINIHHLPINEAQVKGYTLSLKVKSETEQFSKFNNSENIVCMFNEALSHCIPSFQLGDKRLSFVLPGIRKTQVGANVSFAWEGSEYPLLLIDVDLVPVLEVPWPRELERPMLTPPSIHSVHIASTGDGNWRCSFAVVENLIFRELSQEQRLVLLACKLLVVSLKTESWAPRYIKEQFTYWDGRRFKIPLPAGFILKSAFLRELEEVKGESLWHPSNLMMRMRSVFRRMCKTDDTSSINDKQQRYFHGKVKAYFGGECEKATVGLSAPEILRFLETW